MIELLTVLIDEINDDSITSNTLDQIEAMVIELRNQVIDK